MMIVVSVSTKKFLEQKIEAYAYLLAENFSFEKELGEIARLYAPHLKNYIQEQKFTGKSAQICVVLGHEGAQVKHIILVGLGSILNSSTDKKSAAGAIKFENIRRAIARIIRAAEARKIAHVAVSFLSKDFFMKDSAHCMQLVTTAAQMASYRFNEFVTDVDSKGFDVKELICVIDKKYESDAKEGITKGTVIAQAVNETRYWIDLPANKMVPKDLVDRAKTVAKKHKLTCTVFDEKKIESLGMGGLKAVGMGSQHDPYLVILEYVCKTKKAPTLAFVGKGITFDSGGLNLKPTGYMETMKEDMSGAAAVINVISAIAEMKLQINVVAVAAIAENMPGGESNRPGDIITFYNGKTSVVGNTDAEGRLVLADALSYTHKHFKPTVMIDVATLTGAVSHAIGPFFSGLLSQDEAVVQNIEKAAESSGDFVWRLPLTDDYKVMVKNDIADLCNDGKTKYMAGPTNGACFLQNFVGDTPWAHLDIASTAFDVPDLPYYRNGATGAATRLLIDFAELYVK